MLGGRGKSRIFQPFIGHHTRDLPEQFWCNSLGQRLIGNRQGIGGWQQDMVADLREGRARPVLVVVLGVVHVERCAMIDQKEPPMPPEQIGVARRAIDIGDEGVKPDDERSQFTVQRAG